MKRIVEISLKQAVINNILFVTLMLIGVYCLFVSPVERYPNIHMGDVFLSTYFYGASPSDVEKLITSKLEREIHKMEEVDFMRSQSTRNRSMIKVHFKDGTNYFEAIEKLKTRVQNIRKEMPDIAEKTTYTEAKTSEWMPVVQMNVIGEHDMNALSLIARDLKIQLERIANVSTVQISGEFEQEYHIKLSPSLMRKFGVPFQAISRAIESTNVNIPTGSLKVGSHEIYLKADEMFKSTNDVLNVIIRKDGDGSYVVLGDLVTVAEMGYQKPSVISTANGKKCIGLRIIKGDKGNVLSIKAEALGILKEFKDKYGDIADFDIVLTNDNTKKVSEALEVLGWSLFIGVILVFCLLSAFLGVRNSMLASVGVPFSCLITMIFLKLTGNSVNEISLFSFVLVSGIIVDDAIVVIENIYSHLEEGKDLRTSVVDGTAEVIKPIFCATLTTICAFLPLLLMTGAVGDFFAIIPISVSFALTASFIEAIFMLPLHFYDFAPKKIIKRSGAVEKKKWVIWIEDKYIVILKFCLNNKFLSISFVTILGVFCVSALLLSMSGKSRLIKVQLFPDTFPHYYVVIEGPVSTPLDVTNQYLKIAADKIMEGGAGEYAAVNGDAGFYMNEDFQLIFDYHYGMLTVILPERDNLKLKDYPINNMNLHIEDIQRRVKSVLPENVKITVRGEKEGPPRGKPVSVRIFGQNENSVYTLAEKLRVYLETSETLKGLKDIGDNTGKTRNVASLKTKTLKAKEYNLDKRTVLSVASGLIDGQIIGKFRGTRDDVNLKVMVDESVLNKPEDILNIPIIEDSKSPVLLSDIAQFSYVPEKSELNRYNEQRSIEIFADISENSDLTSAVVANELKEYYDTIAKDYVGAQVNFEGEFQSTSKSYESLYLAFGVSVLSIYIIIAWQFQSYIQPLVIITSIFYAGIGVVFGLLVTRQLFTVNNFIAVIGLAGVAVNDSLVLIEFINQSRQKGMSVREALYDGCRKRMRPILLTTLTTTLGLLPMAIGIPYYSPVWGGMASSFVYGLCTATFLIVTVTPVIYEIIENIKIKIYGKDFYSSGEFENKKKLKKIRKVRKVIRRVNKQTKPEKESERLS